MTPEEISALFARQLEARRHHDVVTIAADYAENCVVETRMSGKQFGRAAVEKVYREFFAAFPDADYEFGDLFISGNQVALAVTVYGTDTGGFLGQAPTGKRFRLFMVVLHVIEGEGITFARHVADRSGAVLQLAGRGTDEGAQLYRATLERARFDHEHTLAAAVQRALLPERQRTGTGFEVAGASIPCRAIGGDFLDYFELPNGAFGFALGDVAGKGPPAALLAAQLQGVLATQSSSDSTPSQTIARANQVLMRRPVEARFATVLYGVLSEGRLTYCNAGHNPTLPCRSARTAATRNGRPHPWRVQRSRVRRRNTRTRSRRRPCRVQ